MSIVSTKLFEDAITDVMLVVNNRLFSDGIFTGPVSQYSWTEAAPQRPRDTERLAQHMKAKRSTRAECLYGNW
jgi:hypothetical protein